MFGLDAQSSILAWVILGTVYAVDLLIRLWLLYHIPKRRRPNAALAWLLLIYIIPVFGTIFFFIIGTPKLSRRRRDIQKDVNRAFEQQTQYLQKTKHVAKVPGKFGSVANLATSLTSLAPTTHNHATVLYGYDSIITHIINAVNHASHHVLVEFYALVLDETTEPFFAALERATRRGVEVYVLFDAWGARKYPHHKEMKQRLDEIGVQWRAMLPFSLNPAHYNRPDLRNHRKLVVIDTKEAYVGSLNMIDKHYHRKDDISYIELVLHLRGPSVTQVSAIFTGDWYAETGEPPAYTLEEASSSSDGSSIVQVVPSGSSYQYRNNLQVFVALIHRAEHSIIINNPYLVPEESLLSALIAAAKRGIHVSILNSEAIDQWAVGHAQRSYYHELLEAGVVISLYKKPQLVHDKFITIDDEVGVIGSSNLDIRSFELNLECVVVCYDAKVATTLREHHEELLTRSQSISLEVWKMRPVASSLAESLTRLSSSLQ